MPLVDLSIGGLHCFPGLHTVSRRIVASTFPVSSSSSGYCGLDAGTLVSRPMTAFTKVLEVLRNHADKQYHKDAVPRSDDFLKVMMYQYTDIRSQLSQA